MLVQHACYQHPYKKSNNRFNNNYIIKTAKTTSKTAVTTTATTTTICDVVVASDVPCCTYSSQSRNKLRSIWSNTGRPSPLYSESRAKKEGRQLYWSTLPLNNLVWLKRGVHLDYHDISSWSMFHKLENVSDNGKGKKLKKLKKQQNDNAKLPKNKEIMRAKFYYSCLF